MYDKKWMDNFEEALRRAVVLTQHWTRKGENELWDFCCEHDIFMSVDDVDTEGNYMFHIEDESFCCPDAM